jgi:hypothetical protein
MVQRHQAHSQYKCCQMTQTEYEMSGRFHVKIDDELIMNLVQAEYHMFHYQVTTHGVVGKSHLLEQTLLIQNAIM